MGAMLNAYTSHDLVAFHITSRAEAAARAIDLLSDIAGRPRSTPAELERERGVVIQEIARANDQPATVAEHLIDRAAFGDHPLGRPVLGPQEHLRSFSREEIVAFRARRWSPQPRRRIPRRQHRPSSGRRRRSMSASLASRPRRPPTAFVPAPGVRAAYAGRGARHQPVAPALGLPIADRRARPRQRARAQHLLDAARRLDGLTPVRRDARAARPLLLGLVASTTASPTRRCSGLGAGLDSAKCIEAYTLMREIVDSCAATGPTEEEVERARAYATGRACSPSRTPARSRAMRRPSRSSTTTSSTPTSRSTRVDAVSFERGRRGGARDQR